MPPVSQAQRAWAFANKDKPGAEGTAAREFANADPGGKLPARVKDGKPRPETREERRRRTYAHPRSRQQRGD